MTEAIKTGTADVLMFAGQVVQGLENAKSGTLRANWADWAVHVVTTMGRLIHSYDQEHVTYGRLLESAERAEFLLAVAAACAEQEIGDLIHDNAELMTAANIEANEAERLSEFIRAASRLEHSGDDGWTAAEDGEDRALLDGLIASARDLASGRPKPENHVGDANTLVRPVPGKEAIEDVLMEVDGVGRPFTPNDLHPRYDLYAKAVLSLLASSRSVDQ